MKQNDMDRLFSAAKSGNKDEIEKLGSELKTGLSKEQLDTVEKALSDQEFLRNILSSPKAQKILNKLQEGDI